MTIRPIRNDDDLKKVFRRLEKIFQAEEGTAQADERAVLRRVELARTAHAQAAAGQQLEAGGGFQHGA